MRHSAMIAAAVSLVCASAADAFAEVVVRIDKSVQQMFVSVDGFERYRWPVSTGLLGGPPSGTYHPLRMERVWYSRKFDMSPMPYSIFFRDGYAIHGTIYVSRLGTRASHGCVRLLPENAAILFSLVQQQGMDRTQIMIER